MSTHSPGGWSNFDFTLTPEAKHVFEYATAGLQGVKYAPFAFATQMFAGTNYSFLCEAVLVSRNPTTNVVKMRIFQSLDSKEMPAIASIEMIAP